MTQLDRASFSRSSFAWWLPIASRWADCDGYGHVNNAVYLSWFDTALTTLAIERGILHAPGQTSIGLCVASSCEFLAPIGFPQTVHAAVRLGRIGDKSLTYELALFDPDGSEPLAIGQFTHVYVDRTSRIPVPLDEEQKSAVRDLLRL